MTPAERQRTAARETGNGVRLEAAALRREMMALPPDASRERAAELLRDPPEAMHHLRVLHFLKGINRFGERMAFKYLHLAGIGGAWDRRIGPCRAATRVGHLTERQRHALALALEVRRRL